MNYKLNIKLKQGDFNFEVTYELTYMKIIGLLIAVVTGIIGYNINDQSIFWAILNGFFWVITWIKWLICQDVNLTIIKQSLSWFFN